MDSTSALIFAFTIIFSPFAGIIAYFITNDEYQHHSDSKKAKHHALQTALFTFVIFVAVGLISGYGFRYISTH